MAFLPATRLGVGIAIGMTIALLLPTVTTAQAQNWRPTGADRLYVQFSGDLDVPPWATMVEIDGLDSDASEVTRIHAGGRRAVCYLSAGSAEQYREDLTGLPTSVLGRPLVGWPDERWLDIRQLDVLLPWIQTRVQRCADKEFDAVEFDNVDAYAHRTGFPITREQQYAYLNALSQMARASGLSPGLKNAPELAPMVRHAFDWVLLEECVQYRFCGRYAAFVRTGAPVFDLEYGGFTTRACQLGRKHGVVVQFTNLALDGTTRPCRQAKLSTGPKVQVS